MAKPKSMKVDEYIAQVEEVLEQLQTLGMLSEMKRLQTEYQVKRQVNDLTGAAEVLEKMKAGLEGGSECEMSEDEILSEIAWMRYSAMETQLNLEDTQISKCAGQLQ